MSKESMDALVGDAHAALNAQFARLKEKADELEEELAYAHAQREDAQRIAHAALDERDALAAHVERWHGVYVDLTNSMMTFDGVTHYVADNAMMRRFDEIDESSPTTFLARLKAEWQAEALDTLATRSRYDEVYGEQVVPADELKKEAGLLRRQAEGGE